MFQLKNLKLCYYDKGRGVCVERILNLSDAGLNVYRGSGTCLRQSPEAVRGFYTSSDSPIAIAVAASKTLWLHRQAS